MFNKLGDRLLAALVCCIENGELNCLNLCGDDPCG